jgi:nitrite reductase/ring-hydroxylating ferredoxin subunit
MVHQPYGAYLNRDVPQEDIELTHVGPGTPAGEYLRRFWQPVFRTENLKDLPVPLRIMGEDLVVFRDRSGHIGLLQRHCAHRGASLEYGIIEQHGIRCCYHGWHFDVDGRILEMPNEVKGPYRGRLCQGAYPVIEFAGLVFAYMGPPERKPPFRMFDTFSIPGYDLACGDPVGISNLKPCNWLQIMDNVMDPIHEAFLHWYSEAARFVDRNGREVKEIADPGELRFAETPIGLVCQEIRHIEDFVWVRTLEYIAPNIAQIVGVPVLPPDFGGSDRIFFLPPVTRWRVPVDDNNTVEYAIVRVPQGAFNAYSRTPSGVIRANYSGRSYEEMQRHPGDYEAQIGQRQIARHRLENLGAADRGVVMMREMIRSGIHAVQAGHDPHALLRAHTGPIPTYGHDTMVRDPEGKYASSVALKALAEDVVREALQASPAGRRGARL